MTYKVCRRCGKELPITDFYDHPQMADKHLNICKGCVKSRVRERYGIKSQDDDFIERERIRSREKYHRLGYAKKRTTANNLKREKYVGLRNARAAFHFHSTEYVELHHWNYNRMDQVICLDKRLHKRIHGLMEFDLEAGYYFRDGEPLDTLEKHLNVIRFVCDRDGFDYTDVKVLTKQ